MYYAHFDKMPPLDPLKWSKGGPTKPTIIDGKLYGRGVADDGFAIFLIGIAIKSLQNAHIDHSRIIITIESCEESEEQHAIYYFQKIEKAIGKIDLIIAMDAAIGDTNRVWNTVSLRGNLKFRMKVRYLLAALHSGMSGLIGDPYTICRALLNRLQDPETLEMIKELQVELPPNRFEEIKKVAALLGKFIPKMIPFVKGACCPVLDEHKLLTNFTWKPSLTVIGCDGIPSVQAGNNIVSNEVSMKVSVRIPPLLDIEKANDIIKSAILKNPICGTTVEFESSPNGYSFDAGEMPKWLDESINSASKALYKNESIALSNGTSIPLMGWLRNRFQGTAFWVSGVACADSFVHSLNENLNLEYTKRFCCIVTTVIADFQIMHSVK
jgi:acetylornithine deacetylase/succinyl-diaminopimelate desuccinylase-like protein